MSGEENKTQDMRPVPDPTLLTTQQLLREIDRLGELLETKLDGVQKVFEQRFDGNDKAIELLQAASNNFPKLIDEKIASLEQVTGEKFTSIQVQFRERDVRAERESTSSKVAIDAALQATKESSVEQNKSFALATAKSEAGFAKQIDQLGVLIHQMTKSFDEKIDDLKERMTRFEGTGAGEKGGRTSQQQMIQWILMIIVALIAIAGFFRGLRV